MRKPIRIGCSPLTGTIYAGTLLKDGRTWYSDKQDVTIDALVSVAEHAIAFGKPVVLSSEDGTPMLEIVAISELPIRQ